MFEFSVSKDIEILNNNNKRIIPAYILTLIIKELKTSIVNYKPPPLRVLV